MLNDDNCLNHSNSFVKKFYKWYVSDKNCITQSKAK